MFIETFMCIDVPWLCCSNSSDDTVLTPALQLELKLMLPAANVSSVAARCPNLLLSPVWERVPQRRQELQQMLPPGGSLESVVEAVPLVLMIELGEVAADLRRLIPGCDPGEVLAANPAIILNTMNISHLSMW